MTRHDGDEDCRKLLQVVICGGDERESGLPFCLCCSRARVALSKTRAPIDEH